ncbi:IS66 family transposase [Microbulbifer epialgicus]|uniref:Transposase n=1 Tax=Microbulbifer epialgicus TaxID=393907 RepID=A0ABV4P7M7_9GAMM
MSGPNWNGLCAILINDGRLDIDNDLTEQEIKPFVMARNNFLFASSVKALQQYAFSLFDPHC